MNKTSEKKSFTSMRIHQGNRSFSLPLDRQGKPLTENGKMMLQEAADEASKHVLPSNSQMIMRGLQAEYGSKK